RLAAVHPSLGSSPRLSGLTAAGNPAGERAWLEIAMTPARATELVRIQVARILQMPQQDLDRYDTLAEAGLDSLSSLELRNALELECGLNIAIGRFSRADTVDELAELLCDLARDKNSPDEDAEEASSGSRAAE
ncbi:MAG: acyl carrier protein, partial [Hyphomicrobiales bacterium]